MRERERSATVDSALDFVPVRRHETSELFDLVILGKSTSRAA
jgi:hypothetical protein